MPSFVSFVSFVSSVARFRSSYAFSGSVVRNARPALTSASVAARPKISRYAFWIRAVVVRLGRHPPRQQLALLLHEVAVHEEQPLQRHGGREALLGRQVRARKIEQLQVVVELVAADLAVDRAPVDERRQRRRRPAHLRCRARRRRTAASRGPARRSCGGGRRASTAGCRSPSRSSPRRARCSADRPRSA